MENYWLGRKHHGRKMPVLFLLATGPLRRAYRQEGAAHRLHPGGAETDSALLFMAKMMMTQAHDMEHRGQPMLVDPLLSPESGEWCAAAQRKTLLLLEAR